MPVMGAPLEKLPLEIFDQICTKLPQHEMTVLARVSKGMNNMVQDHLYRHAVVTSYASLALLMRTMDDAAGFNKWGDVISKDIKDLTIIVDMAKPQRGDLGTVVVLTRMLDNIIRYCKQIKITLQVLHASCQSQPITSFSSGVFRRIKLLVLHTGFDKPPEERRQERSEASSSRSQLISQARDRFDIINSRASGNRSRACQPNAQFWTAIFNGSFPDLEEVVVAHVGPVANTGAYWAASNEVVFKKDDLESLSKLVRLSIDAAPELNDSVLFSALTRAPSLKKLSLKNIHGLTYEALSQLLVFALPNLAEFTLHVSKRNHIGANSWRYMDVENFHEKGKPHLCPLIREYGRNLQLLDLFLPTVCRELFLSPAEMNELVDADIKTYDLYMNSVRRVLPPFRKNKEVETTQVAIASRISAAKNEGRKLEWANVEYEEEAKKRERASKMKREQWQRNIRASKGLCKNEEGWEELCCLAELDEPGLIWKLGHERLNKAGTYVSGEMGIEATYEELFGTRADDTPQGRRRSIDGHDFNDDQAI